MNWFKIFEHAPYKEEIKDPDLIKKNYKYWRMRIFYSMYIGYAFFYITRKSFTFAMPAMMVDLGFSKADLGILGSVLYITYGLSKFISGMMSDRSNPRYFMAFGLILTGFFNIFFGMTSSILLFAIFWGLNGWFQGWGWPPCARLLTHWYSQSERGTWWGIASTSHNVGGAIIPVLVVFVAEALGWRMAMYVPGILCIIVGLFLINRLRDTPQSLGLPTIEVFKGETTSQKKNFEEKELSQKEMLFEYVLKNKYIWILAFAYFFVYIIRTVINDWGLVYLYEYKQFSLIAAGSCIFSFELGGFFGCLASGFLSDKLFKGRRGPINAIFGLFVVLSVLALWYTPVGGIIFASIVMFAIGFFIFGPQMLVGVAATELSHKKAAGTAVGFIGWFGYAGAATAGFPFAKITQEYGWGMFFVVLGICSIVMVLLLLPVWSIKSREQEEFEEEKGSNLEPEAG
ncbi:MAG: MFS transporter [Chlamydiae bacterium]|nr:MFS transporter [Chlamydiota bacterium]